MSWARCSRGQNRRRTLLPGPPQYHVSGGHFHVTPVLRLLGTLELLSASLRASAGGWLRLRPAGRVPGEEGVPAGRRDIRCVAGVPYGVDACPWGWRGCAGGERRGDRP